MKNALPAAFVVGVILVTAGGPISAVLGGAFLPLPPQDEAVAVRAAAEGLEGSSGTFAADLGNTTWVDIAFALNLSGDFEVTISWEWVRPENPGTEDDAGQFWDCEYLGPKAKGPSDAPWWTSWCHLPTNAADDGRWEVAAEADGQQVEAGVPLPVCEIDGVCSGPLKLGDESTYDDEYFEEHWPRAKDGQVVHFVRATGGRYPVRMNVRVEWENTTVAMTHGGPEDAVMYLRDEFRSEAYARADLTGQMQPYFQYQANRTHRVAPDDTPTVFWYRPESYSDVPGMGNDWEHGYVRPDGTGETDDGWLMVAFAETAGPWEFWLDGSLKFDPYGSPWGEAPVLFGSTIEWAEVHSG